MSEQQDLFADTSIRAFEAAQDKIGGRHMKILAYVDACGASGATLDEICIGCRMLTQTASARVSEIVQSGQLQDSGRRRPTRSGASARIYLRRNPKFIVSASIVPSW